MTSDYEPSYEERPSFTPT